MMTRSGSTILSRIAFFSYSGCASTSGLSEEKTSSAVWQNSGSCAFFALTSAMTLSMYGFNLLMSLSSYRK